MIKHPPKTSPHVPSNNSSPTLPTLYDEHPDGQLELVAIWQLLPELLDTYPLQFPSSLQNCIQLESGPEQLHR